MNYPVYLEKLINYYKKLPGIGEKSAERLAIATLDFNNDEIEEIRQMCNLWSYYR